MGFQLPTSTGEFSGLFPSTVSDSYPESSRSTSQPSLRVLRIKHSRRRKSLAFPWVFGNNIQFQVAWSAKSSAKKVQGPSKIHPTNLQFCIFISEPKACFPSSRSQDDDICWYVSSCDSFSAQPPKKHTTSI